jgi:tripartite ATP-independent transporter DctM subunit
MSPFAVGLLCIVGFLVLLFMGIPVAYDMILVGTVGICILRNPASAMQIVGSDLYVQFSSYTMSVVPLFGLMGFLAHYSGIGEKLFTTANKFVGHCSGGLAVATDVACAGFGAICGSVPATIATMGSIAYPQMKRYKYHDTLSCGIIAAGSSLSILIPPSVMLIVYGIATETSVGALFAGGILPGILLCLLYGAAIVIRVKLNPSLAAKSERATWKERAQTLFRGGVIEVLIVFIFSIGGLFAGLFTPTEAGAVGAAGMLAVCLIERKINFRDFMLALTDSVKLSAMVMILVAAATIFGRLFALSRIPNVLGSAVAEMDAPAWVIMSVMVLIYFAMGCFVDAFSAVLITIPVFFPIVTDTLGYDPIWFCVMMVVVLSMGGLTPPVGMNVFMTKGVIKEAKMQDIFKGILPFLLCQVILAALLIFFPWICTWLPKVLV